MEEIIQPDKPTDNAIQRHIMDRLQHDPAIDSRKIKVEVQNGKVILKGGIDTEAEKQLSEKVARAVEGVTTVENHLHIDLGLAHALSNLAAHIQGDIIKEDEEEEEAEK